MSEDERRSAPAAQRNREPIREKLAPLLPESGVLLEIACGTGEHSAHFAQMHPQLTFQPCDPDPSARSSADAWAAHLGLANMRPARPVDVTQGAWWRAFEGDHPALIYCANMIHISPWAACEGLLTGAGALLSPGARLVLYGPYLRADVETVPSNQAFDASLRSRNPEWGIRALEDVEAVAHAHEMESEALFEMPANNYLVVLRRTEAA